jgi:hypothetical protein
MQVGARRRNAGCHVSWMRRQFGMPRPYLLVDRQVHEGGQRDSRKSQCRADGGWVPASGFAYQVWSTDEVIYGVLNNFFFIQLRLKVA